MNAKPINGWKSRLALVAGVVLIAIWASRATSLAPDPNALKVQGPDTIGNLVPIQSFPPSSSAPGATALSQSSANAAATNNLSLAAVAGQTTYCTGFQITGAGATATSNIQVTLTGVATQTQNYKIVIPAGATTSINPLIVNFSTPIAASAQNQVITLNVPSFGAGNTDAAAAIQGFRQ